MNLVFLIQTFNPLSSSDYLDWTFGLHFVAMRLTIAVI